MAPARFTANSACRAEGFAAALPFPCESLKRFRTAASPSITAVQPPRIWVLSR